jgi:hypothetical protein
MCSGTIPLIAKVGMRLKVLIDFLMTTLLLVAFAYPFIGNRYHEVNGISLGALFILHHILNKRWYLSLFKGRYSFRRSMGTFINFALSISMLAILGVSVPISQSMFAFLGIEGGSSLSRIHIVAANWLFVLISMHLGLHWDVVIGLLRRAARGAEEMRCKAVVAARIAAFATALYGIQAALHRNIGPKLIMYYSFDLARAGDTIPRFILDYIAIIGLFIWTVHYSLKLGIRTARRRLNGKDGISRYPGIRHPNKLPRPSHTNSKDLLPIFKKSQKQHR